MPGYGQTYLQGLQQMSGMAMQRRLADERDFNNEFNRRLHSENLNRQYQVLAAQERQRAMQQQQWQQNQQRLIQMMANSQAQRDFSNRAQLSQLELAIKRLGLAQKTAEQPHFGPIEDLVGPDFKSQQVQRDTKTNKLYKAGTMEELPPNVAGTLRKAQALPHADREALRKMGEMYQNYISLIKDYKPDYQASVPLELVGEMQRFASERIPGMDPGMANWWRNYQKLSRMPERHGISGSALSSREIGEYERGDINTAMRAEDVRNTLLRRLALTQRGIARGARSLAGKYNPQEVMDALGMQDIPGAPSINPNDLTEQALIRQGDRLINPLSDIVGR